MAFPWLFPGGIGDINEPRLHPIYVSDWAQNLLYYEDGRFAKDKLWSFFVLNYIYRHRNQASSHFFLSDFMGKIPPTLSELQQKIQNNDNNFIDKLCYFSKTVPNSAGFWRSKRAELYSWINYNIEKGRGAPTMFMTFSCGEYFWPDLKRLLQEYIFVIEKRKVDLDKDQKRFMKAINDYSIVIQEFFHLRIRDFLNSVGLNIFGILHYWLRFEFGRARGQIHGHLVAITKDAIDPNGIYQKLWKLKKNRVAQAKALANWAKETFNMTASIRETTVETTSCTETNPCKLRFCDISSLEKDQDSLCKFCQMHSCSDYCLRLIKHQNPVSIYVVYCINVSYWFFYNIFYFFISFFL
jgi:hypothetical protein